MKKTQEKLLRDVVRDQSVVLVQMQRTLMDAGLVATAARVNIASQKLGWEAAKLLERKSHQRIEP